MKNKSEKELAILERMTDEELIALADESVPVPAELSERLDSLEERLENRERRPIAFSLVCATSVAAALSALLFLRSVPEMPQDTFSTPEEAYEMLENAFSHISEKASSATDALARSVNQMETSIIDIYR